MAKDDRICSVSGCNKTFYGRGLCQSHLRSLRLYGDPLANRNAKRGETWQFFEDIASKYDGEDCLTWPFGGQSSLQYPQIMKDRKVYSVTRMLCEQENGSPASDTDFAAHSCGNGHKGCVNRKHLRWATALENSQDRRIHGTVPFGEKSGTAKLSESQARHIKFKCAHLSERKLAAMYGVSSTAIRYIKIGRNWGWLT